jgi:hypothetical protein
MRRLLVVLSLSALPVTGCGKKEEAPAKPAMTQRQRDSVIGASALPGARGVQNALRAQDSIQARNHRLDSIQ